VPGSIVVADVFEFTHTDAVTACLALITVAARPVLLRIFPVMARRVVPVGHFPFVLLGANLIAAFVVPWLLAHLIVLMVDPLNAPVPFAVVPVPPPPVAASGKHFDSVMCITVPTTFVVILAQLAG
jgi:hypothetical protein